MYSWYIVKELDRKQACSSVEINLFAIRDITSISNILPLFDSFIISLYFPRYIQTVILKPKLVLLFYRHANATTPRQKFEKNVLRLCFGIDVIFHKQIEIGNNQR